MLKNITRFLEQDEAKTNFMATISHELKTPISSLNLNLKLLDDTRIGMLNEEQQDIVKALRSETNKMLTITTGLLDLAQVESGNIQLHLQRVHVEQLFRYIDETSENQAKSKNITMIYHLGPGINSVFADFEKTAWVLINLINNAIQYSDRNSEVKVEAVSQKNEVVFKVQDHGKGIEEKFLGLIFDKFFRVPK